MASHNHDSVVSTLQLTPSQSAISQNRQSLLYAIETYPVVVLVGDTGSGSSELPLFLDQAGWCSDGKQIAITQTRGVAATSSATRVANELRCDVGQDVGYSVRFEDMTCPTTRIKFLTDALLLREALVDPLLSRYSVIMVDEAHERSISTDILLSVLKKIKKRRPELRIVVNSTAFQAEIFLRFFIGEEAAAGKNGVQESTAAKIIKLTGSTYPVDCLYLDTPTDDYVERAVKTVLDIHTGETKGDILVFLTGKEEIDSAVQKISEQPSTLNRDDKTLLPLPLYAGLTTEEQHMVFESAPEDTRKAIFATNIAEASVTIEGIVYVVDCGYAKIRIYNPSTRVDKLTSVPISKASATQRAGHAGKTKHGKCFRLYTKQSYSSLPDETAPEMQRSNLAPTILQLKALGIDNIVRFDFISPPPSELLLEAFHLLSSLGAIDDDAKLSKPTGIQMAELPLEPMMAKVLLNSVSFGCLDEVLSIAAVTSYPGSIWFDLNNDRKAVDLARHRFGVEEGDHLTYLNVYRAFTAKGMKNIRWCRDNCINHKAMMTTVSIHAQLKRHLTRFGIEADKFQPNTSATSEQIQRCLTSGYFAQSAKMQPDGSFKSITGGFTLYAHPSSLMFDRRPEWVIFDEILETHSKIYIKNITKVNKPWLLEYGSDYYQIKE